MNKPRQIITRRGIINFPAYIPVTTFGQKYPLDELIRPYLPRLSPAVMVSRYYAQEMTGSFRLPVLIDSGGFAALFNNSKVIASQGLGIIKLEKDSKKEVIDPRDVLQFQEATADVAFTLDFPIPPGLDSKESEKRRRLTIKNALWALENKRRQDLLLYGVIQAWDKASARETAAQYASAGFNGIAIGGLVPRARNLELIREIVGAVREVIPDLPLHVFGLGKPEIIGELFRMGVDSVDSSSYVKMAADGRIWGQSDQITKSAICPTDRLHMALCNLANATGATLPLSASRLMFSTRII